MKIINLRRLIAASLVALGAFAFIACSVEASVNDGATAEVRLSKGYKEAPKDPVTGDFDGGQTTDKFWKGYKPFIGIQVWGPSEGWGQAPVIDMTAGTITALDDPNAPKCMFPVFGGFDEKGASIIGTYDCSKVRKIEFDIKASRAGGTATFASYVSGEEKKHATDEAISTEFVKKSYTVTGTKDVDKLFFFNIAIPATGYVVTINNVAFYDADGNQLTEIPFTPND